MNGSHGNVLTRIACKLTADVKLLEVRDSVRDSQSSGLCPLHAGVHPTVTPVMTRNKMVSETNQ